MADTTTTRDRQVEISEQATETSSGIRLLLVAVGIAIAFHGGLLPFTHGNTYEAFTHMFFADHYYQNWFDPWEPRWYMGFNTTSSSPGTHMLIAALEFILPLRAAFVVVQLAGIVLLTIGVFRFSRLWVSPRASGYAAIALVFASSLSGAAHLFGHLPMIFSLGIFLNGTSYVYRWIVFGRFGSFAAAIIIVAAVTATHHVTTIFASGLIIGPIVLQGLRATSELRLKNVRLSMRYRLALFGRPIIRTLFLAVFVAISVVLVIFPYWVGLIFDPVPQISMPLAVRENFIDRIDLGFVYFLLPWGTSLIVLPYTLFKSTTTHLWPLGVSVFLCLLLGIGGTTPISSAILGPAFDVANLHIFTFWATILILPFVGLMIDGLLNGRSCSLIQATMGKRAPYVIVSALAVGTILIAVFSAILPLIKPTQPTFVDPAPIRQFLETEDHSRWRYLALGFGDQIGNISSQTNAHFVGGNSRSSQNLPNIPVFLDKPLNTNKYLGGLGLDALQQFLINAELYNLKYVLSNDEFYNPLLYFSGWDRHQRLSNGVVIWQKPGIAPLPLDQSRLGTPGLLAMMWGVLPPVVLIAAALILITGAMRPANDPNLIEFRPIVARKSNFSYMRFAKFSVFFIGGITTLAGSFLIWLMINDNLRPDPPNQIITQFFTHLELQRFDKAYALLDPETREPFVDVVNSWRANGMLTKPISILTDITVKPSRDAPDQKGWNVQLDWMTSLNTREEMLEVRTVRRNEEWFVVPFALVQNQTSFRINSETTTTWSVSDRGSLRDYTDLYRDLIDQPNVAIGVAQLVMFESRYSVVGQITNNDFVPASVTTSSELTRGNFALAWQSAGIISGERLRPSESAGVRIEFQDVVSRNYSGEPEGFDPNLLTPPVLDGIPDGARIEVGTQVGASQDYRGIALNRVTFTETTDGLLIAGLAANTGAKVSMTSRINVLFFDENGRPVWADVGFVNQSIPPGQSRPFSITVPHRDQITVIGSIDGDQVLINGLSEAPRIAPPNADFGTIPLNGSAGYRSVRFHVTSLTENLDFRVTE